VYPEAAAYPSLVLFELAALPVARALVTASGVLPCGLGRVLPLCLLVARRFVAALDVLFRLGMREPPVDTALTLGIGQEPTLRDRRRDDG
jgi:hypothetical protein